jgi:hypothetical protein
VSNGGDDCRCRLRSLAGLVAICFVPLAQHDASSVLTFLSTTSVFDFENSDSLAFRLSV